MPFSSELFVRKEFTWSSRSDKVKKGVFSTAILVMRVPFSPFPYIEILLDLGSSNELIKISDTNVLLSAKFSITNSWISLQIQLLRRMNIGKAIAVLMSLTHAIDLSKIQVPRLDVYHVFNFNSHRSQWS